VYKRCLYVGSNVIRDTQPFFCWHSGDVYIQGMWDNVVSIEVATSLVVEVRDRTRTKH